MQLWPPVFHEQMAPGARGPALLKGAPAAPATAVAHTGETVPLSLCAPGRPRGDRALSLGFGLSGGGRTSLGKAPWEWLLWAPVKARPVPAVSPGAYPGQRPPCLDSGEPALRVRGGSQIPGFVVTVLTHRHTSPGCPAGQRGCAGLCGAVRAWLRPNLNRAVFLLLPPPAAHVHAQCLNFSPNSGQRQAFLQRPRAGGGGGSAAGG